MDENMSEKLYGYYVSQFIELANNFKKYADPKIFTKRIEETIKSEEFSNDQKVIIVKLEYKDIIKTISKTQKGFEKLSRIINNDAINIRFADGKNLATLTSKFISETDDKVLLERYYKLFDVFVKKGVNPNHKDNNNLDCYDYIYWAKQSAQKETTLAHLKNRKEKTK